MPPLAASAPATLTAAYERLRAWASGPAPPGPRPPGLALFLQRGTPGWLAALPAWLPAAAVPTTPVPVAPAARPAVVPAGDLAHVLATMVAACQPEVQP